MKNKDSVNDPGIFPLTAYIYSFRHMMEKNFSP